MPPKEGRPVQGLPVLMYHSLSDGRFPDGEYFKYTITRKNFQEHVDTLSAKGFSLISVADLVAHVQQTGEFPSNACIMTFDDGHRSSLEMAEILTAAGGRGTFFLTADYCRNRPEFLGDDEILAIAAMGHEVGGHGTTHRSLGHMPEEEMKREIYESKTWLENLVSTSLVSMSLPAGQGGMTACNHAFSLGFKAVGNSIERRNFSPQIPLVLNRFVVLHSYSPQLVVRISQGSRTYETLRHFRSEALRIPKAFLRSFNRVRQ